MARVPSGMTREGEHPGLAAGLSHVRGKDPTSSGRRSGIGHCYIFTASFDLRAMGCGRATVIANKRRPIGCSDRPSFRFFQSKRLSQYGEKDATLCLRTSLYLYRAGLLPICLENLLARP